MKWNIVYLCFLLFSCGTDTSSMSQDVLSEKQMKLLLIDVHLADAIAINEKIVDVKVLNQVKKKYLTSVLEKNGVSLEKFEKSLLFYQKRTEIFFDLYEDVMIELSTEEALNNGEKIEDIVIEKEEKINFFDKLIEEYVQKSSK